MFKKEVIVALLILISMNMNPGGLDLNQEFTALPAG